MKIPDVLVNHIRQEAGKIHHGKIIIELNETNNKIDVITESRERFLKEKLKETSSGKKEFRQG